MVQQLQRALMLAVSVFVAVVAPASALSVDVNG
jgi:hypothetical protein